MRYVVVDEIVDNVVTLAVYRWPQADPDGRLRFHLEACRLAVSLQAFSTQLYRKLTAREPRVGDVFGATLTGAAEQWLTTHEDAVWPYALRSLVHGEVYDLSTDARTVAKLAYYAAMTPVLAEEHVDQWNLAAKTEPPAKTARMVDFGAEEKAQGDA